MNVIILTEGGQNIGFGHLTRCLSLYQTFETRKHNPWFIVNGDDSIKDILKDKTFKIFNWIKEKTELIQKIEKTDVVIVDSYLAELDIYKEVSNNAALAAFLDDTYRLHYPPGIIINWNINAKKSGYPNNPNISYLLGAKYISLRKAFWTVEEKEIRTNVNSIMVTFGGDDSKNLTPKILEFLNSHYPKLKKNIIIGQAFNNIADIREVADNNTYLIKSPDDKGMKNVMIESDLAISSGGQTLYELARVGVPTVTIAVAENQVDNITAWEKTGFIEGAGSWKDENLMNHLAVKFQQLLPFERRSQSAKAGQRLVPGNGANRIVDFFEKKFNDVFFDLKTK